MNSDAFGYCISGLGQVGFIHLPFCRVRVINVSNMAFWKNAFGDLKKYYYYCNMSSVD